MGRPSRDSGAIAAPGAATTYRGTIRWPKTGPPLLAPRRHSRPYGSNKIRRIWRPQSTICSAPEFDPVSAAVFNGRGPFSRMAQPPEAARCEARTAPGGWLPARVSFERCALRVDGSCHCGAIAFEAEIDPDQVRVCHCTDCQQLSGTSFRVVAPCPEEQFRMLRGTPRIYVKTASRHSAVTVVRRCTPRQMNLPETGG